MHEGTLALVVTADDLGIDPRRDDGIFEAFERGAITQASLMVAGPSARSAASRARRGGHVVGLHLDLTESAPCAPPDEVRSLLDASGHKLGKHGLRAAVARGSVEPAHVAREARAQIAAFEALTGERPRHVDGHQHVHMIPELVDALATELEAAGITTTRIAAQTSVAGDGGEAHRFYERVSNEAAAARPIYARHGIASTESFLGLDLLGTASSAEGLCDAVRAVRDSRSVELMCHPGYAGAGWDDFNRSSAREHELEILLRLPFAPLVREGWLTLSTFAKLREEGRLA